MVLTRADDFPVHQTPEPIACAGTDRNFYDRYFFNGYAPANEKGDGSGFFALAFGVYPQLDVADAHFSFVRGDKQYSLHASAEMNRERLSLKVGPIAIEIIEPLHQLRVTIDESEGIAGEFTFTARAAPIEEPRFMHRVGARAFMDYTRMTQNGHYTGWISVDGERQDMAEGTCGTRDRSWGVRPVGSRDPQPIPGHMIPAFFWQWTPLNLEGGSLFFHINADENGNPWNTRAAWAADGAGIEDIVEGRGMLDSALAHGTRWPTGGELALDLPHAGERAPARLTLEPVARFQMKGLGYTHPVWGHGVHHGALRVEREDYDLTQLDPAQLDNRHVQMLCKVDGDAQGMGVFEQLVLGAYRPLGLEGI